MLFTTETQLVDANRLLTVGQLILVALLAPAKVQL
jgi:hypothetical protein